MDKPLKLKIKFVILFILFLSSGIFSQNNLDSTLSKDQKAEYVGGKAELDKFIKENLKFPAEYKNIENFKPCKVFVKFIIEETGHIINPQISRGCFGFDACDLEALRLISIMPGWNPWKKDGKAVKRSYSLAIDFSKE